MMSWKDTVKQKVEFNGEDLKKLLFSIIESNDKDALDEICIEYKALILENFHLWRSVPNDLRNDSTKVSQYANTLICIATLFDEKGEPSLINILEDKSNDNNPLLNWESTFEEADKCKQIGEHTEAITLLEKLASDMKNSKGSAVVRYLPMVYGALGENYFLLKEYDLAYSLTQMALKESKDTADVEGVIAYSGNLSEICRKQEKPEEAKNWVVIATNLMIRTGHAEEAERIRALHNINPTIGQ